MVDVDGTNDSSDLSIAIGDMDSMDEFSMDEFAMDEAPPPLAVITAVNRAPDGVAIPLPPADLTDIVRRRSITELHGLTTMLRVCTRPRRRHTHFHRDIVSLQESWYVQSNTLSP